MTEWSLLEHEWPAPPPLPHDPYHYPEFEPYFQKKQHPMESLVPPQAHQFLMPPPPPPVPVPAPYVPALPPKVDSPRAIRNKAEKQRRDRMNRSIAELAAIVPQVVSASRKIDKTSVLRLTAHFIRSDYVFEPPHHRSEFATPSMLALMKLIKGFLISVTYRGLIVVVSHNINEYLGYTELELLGQNVFNIVHEDDRQVMRDQLMPTSQTLGRHGEILVPEGEAERTKMAQKLANEQRSFIVRFKKVGPRSEPSKYVTCHIQGSFKLSQRALRGKSRGSCHIVRRARARGDNPCSSGNDVVFIGVARPTTETFINESALESFRMEYRTRHSVDGEIIECEQRIAMVTGYMMNEVNGINAMNFIHRDEVRWVVFALKDMYYNNQLYGESCYRLMMRNGQFVYMRTRGRLDVDPHSRAVTSFVCTNTVVDEEEGKYLIKLMKQRYMLEVQNDQALSDYSQSSDVPSVPVENPRLLEKVILNLVTNLPSPETDSATTPNEYPFGGCSPSQRLAIIAPKKERIVSAIEKIYTVIKTIPKEPSVYGAVRPIYDVPELGYNVNDSRCLEFGSNDVTDVEFVPKSVYDVNTFEMNNGKDVSMVQQEYNYDTPMPALGTPPYEFNGNSNFEFPSDAVGTKQTGIYDEQLNNDELETASGRDSPALGTLFDDKELTAEIESAMNIMDTIDPNFLDSLISNGVQAMDASNGQ